ncbi:hypothetical protein TruAng_011895 [Truncatella angustata]|nr:hypothetical protein TruAng_011895 [Truncatella angustata]
MSFGFSVGDFLAVIELANRVRKDFAGAPDQFQQITHEIRSLTIVLQDVDNFVASNDLPDTKESDLYEIIGNCRRVLEDLHVRKRVKRVWKRFKWDPDEIRDLRNRITSNITVLDAFTASYTRDNVIKLVVRQDRQEHQEILDWLTPIDTAAQQADFIRRRQPGTGQWLIESPEYSKWKAAKGEVLFCHGMPGAGKTILSSIVVDDLQEWQAVEDVGVCHFYCNFQRHDEQQLGNIVLSFLKQLAQVVATMPACLKALFDKHQARQSRPSLEETVKVLHSIAGLFSKVFCVVDALDECKTVDGCQRQLITQLIDLSTSTGANVLATSRPVPQIMERFGNSVFLEVLAIPSDIRKYVEGNIQDLPDFVSGEPSLVGEITNEIVKATDGMYV